MVTFSTSDSSEYSGTGSDEKKVKFFNVANVLTILRIVLVPVFIMAFLADHDRMGVWRYISLIIFCVAIATDSLDGFLARKYNLTTNFGKIADPIADKVLIISALVMLSSVGQIPWWITVLISGREFIVTVIRFAVIKYDVIPASSGGKVKTVFQTASIILFLLPLTFEFKWLHYIAWFLLLAALLTTVVTGIQYCISAYKLVKEKKEASS